MGAYVDYKFKKGFILDEEKLRKVNEIIITREKNLEIKSAIVLKPLPIFKVYRKDTSTYTTTDIQDIILEENFEFCKIERLKIDLYIPRLEIPYTDQGPLARRETELDKYIFILTLDFDKGTTTLHLEGDNRDYVFLFFSELRQYISEEIDKISKISNDAPLITSTFGLFLTVVSLIIVLLSMTQPKFSGMNIQSALNSTDILQKLNFLLSRYDFSTSSTAFIVFIIISFFGMLLIMTSRYWVPDLLREIRPEYQFLFGKEIFRNQRRKSIYDKILWGIIISLIVAVIGGLITWILINGRQ